MEERFSARLETHSRILFKVVMTYCRNSEDQQDLAQEIKIQLWRAFPGYDDRRSFSTWMYRIALNVAISWVRRTAKLSRSVRLDESVEVVNAPEIDNRTGALYRLIDGLDEFNRALLMLYLDDLSHADIGEILGMTAINVATRISRLKQRLRDQVAKEDGEN